MLSTDVADPTDSTDVTAIRNDVDAVVTCLTRTLESETHCVAAWLLHPDRVCTLATRCMSDAPTIVTLPLPVDTRFHRITLEGAASSKLMLEVNDAYRKTTDDAMAAAAVPLALAVPRHNTELSDCHVDASQVLAPSRARPVHDEDDP